MLYEFIRMLVRCLVAVGNHVNAVNGQQMELHLHQQNLPNGYIPSKTCFVSFYLRQNLIVMRS